MRVYLLLLCLISPGCGTPAAKTALDIAAGPAGEVLARVVLRRFGVPVDPATGVCWELSEGFESGEEELDEDERGAFVICWGRAAR